MPVILEGEVFQGLYDWDDDDNLFDEECEVSNFCQCTTLPGAHNIDKIYEDVPKDSTVYFDTD